MYYQECHKKCATTRGRKDQRVDKDYCDDTTRFIYQDFNCSFLSRSRSSREHVLVFPCQDLLIIKTLLFVFDQDLDASRIRGCAQARKAISYCFLFWYSYVHIVEPVTVPVPAFDLNWLDASRTHNHI